MLQTGEHETEILLGNKQLLGIFFVAAVLLGLAFTGGYMVGRNSSDKKAPIAASAVPTDAATVTPPAATGGETHAVVPDENTGAQVAEPARTEPKQAKTDHERTDSEDLPPLGSPKRKEAEKRAQDRELAPATVAAPAETGSSFLPQSGQTFLQVAAVGRDEAEAVADVLHKKGFRAHAVPKPGSAKIYRVLIGPVRDAGDLSSTRDSLRRTGFREVIVQKY